MSSSSSGDEFIALDSVLPIIILRSKVGVHPINRERSLYDEYHHLFKALRDDDDRFFQYMRMTRETFDYILNKVEHLLVKNWCNLHIQPILPEERLVITLRYLATGSSFKVLSFSFRVGASTIGKIVAETVVSLWTVLQPIHMPVPKKKDFEKIAEDFKNIWNFPHCIGSIDGKHIRVQCPKNSGSMFFNYKKYFSVILQGVADANYKFIIIDVGGYGKQSDGGTFQSSELYKLLNSKQIDIPDPAYLPETTIEAPFVLIGDEAYPLLPYLLKPFGGRNLNMKEEVFNKRLSRARKSIECTFGIITAKWRLLLKCIETDVVTADNIIKCICILHNTIIDREGFERHLTDVTLKFPDHNRWQVTGRPLNEAKAIRDIFVAYFSNITLSFNN